MLKNMRHACTYAGILLDAIDTQIQTYGGEFDTMSAAVTASSGGACDATIATNLGDTLKEIGQAMKDVKLPVGSEEINPMIKYLAEADVFPPDFDKIMGDENEGIISFLFDGFLAVIFVYTI